MDRLKRYLYPTNSELRALIKVPKKIKKSGGKHETGKATVDKFFIPKNLDIDVRSTYSLCFCNDVKLN